VVLRFLIAVLVLASPLSAQIHFRSVEKSVIMQRLASAPDKNSDREQALAELFRAVGCDPIFQLIKHTKSSNVICVLPGKSDKTVIVGGHFDHVMRGNGIIDDWSGASLLPTLYESLKANDREFTYKFIGFAEEEHGLVGSQFYVHEMSKESREQTEAMVNLECLGLTPTKVWASHSDKPLLEILARVAGGMKLEVKGFNVEPAGNADSESFAAAKIPRITIHSVTNETWHVLHSTDDNLKALNQDTYYDSYRMIAGFLSALDSMYERTPAPKATVAAGK